MHIVATLSFSLEMTLAVEPATKRSAIQSLSSSLSIWTAGCHSTEGRALEKRISVFIAQ